MEKKELFIILIVIMFLFLLSTLVVMPYDLDIVTSIGNTTNNSIGVNTLSAEYIHLNTTSCTDTDNLGEGTMCWNPDYYTLNVPTGLGNIIQVGQELTLMRKNKAGKDIYAGQLVYVNDSQGEMITVGLADASDGNKIHMIGMVTIPVCNNNAVCPITYFGDVKDLDTSDYPEGTILYLSADGSGNFTNTLPSGSSYHLEVGRVTRSHASSGIIAFHHDIDESDEPVFNNFKVLNNITLGGVTIDTWDSVNITTDLSDYFTKTETNSTGFIGLECGNGEIIEFNTGVWECGVDSTGSDDQTLQEVLTQGNSATLNITTTGNITADYFTGDGSQLTNLPTPQTYWNRTNTTLYPATSGDNVQLTSSTIDRLSTWNYDSSWAVTGNNITWDDSDANEEGYIGNDFTPTIGKLYKISFDYDISVDSPWDTDLYGSFSNTYLDIPYSDVSSSGTIEEFVYASNTQGFVIYVEDYSEGANVYEFTNIKIEEKENGGYKFDGFMGTDYNDGAITAEKLVLDVDNLIYTGLYGNDIDPINQNLDIGSSWANRWGRVRAGALETNNVYRGDSSNEWLSLASGKIGLRVASANNIYFYQNDFRVVDNYKAMFGTGQDSSIYYTGTNLNINPKAVGSGVVYVEGEVTADGYNEYTFTTNATDEEAYNLVKYATTNFFINETKNYTVWGECYNEIPITDMSRPELETYVEENCFNDDNICINETKTRIIYPHTKTQPTVSLSCKQAMISKADNWEREHMKIVNTTNYGHIIDFDDGIMTENIWTQSKVIEDGVSYIDKIKDKEKLKVKQDHYAYELIDDYELLNMEDRVVALEGAINEIFTLLCDKNILKKEDGCIK